MKTIEQYCQEYADKFSKVVVNGTEITNTIEDLNSFAKEDFRSGIEFAQQWYPISRYPPIDMENDIMKVSPNLLIKETKDYDSVRIGYYLFDKNKWFVIPENEEVFPDFWRPIKLK